MPFLVSAHGDGASFERGVGEYVVDIGYEPAEPRAGERLLLDFKLSEADNTPAEFTSVWVRIQQGSDSILATGVANPSAGPATLLLELPASGEFTLYTRFERTGVVLAEASFPFSVAPSGKKDGEISYMSLLSGLAGLVAGAVGIRLLGNRV